MKIITVGGESCVSQNKAQSNYNVWKRDFRQICLLIFIYIYISKYYIFARNTNQGWLGIIKGASLFHRCHYGNILMNSRLHQISLDKKYPVKHLCKYLNNSLCSFFLHEYGNSRKKTLIIIKLQNICICSQPCTYFNLLCISHNRYNFFLNYGVCNFNSQVR